MNAWNPIVAALVIFSAGVIAGGLTVKITDHKDGHKAEKRRPPGVAQSGTNGLAGTNSMRERKPEAQLQGLMRRMDRELNLDADQRVRVEGAIHECEDRTKRIWDQLPGEFKTMRQNIRSQLRPEQAKRFDEIFRQKDEWRKKQPVP